MFLKIKPLIFHGTMLEDASKFIIKFHERLHKLGVVEMYGVKFVSFQLQRDAKICIREFFECRAISLPPLTWTQFYCLLGKICVMYSKG